jgi:hypothetical protein
LAIKFSSILEDTNYVNHFGGGYYDPTGYARKALNLGNKYPSEQKGEGIMPDGTKVRLLSSQEAKALNYQHRLQLLCKSCNEWIPAGRFTQHEAPCFKKNSPIEYNKKRDLLSLYQKFVNDIKNETNFQTKIDSALVLIDLLLESEDLRWLSVISDLKHDILLYKAMDICKKNYNIDCKFIRIDYKDSNKATFYISDSNNKRYSLYINFNDNTNIINEAV